MTALATPPRATPTLAPPVAEQFETVACYLCGGTESSPFITAEDDLTGKPGRFTFVTCARCGLRYQNPRLTVEHIKSYYDDEYIAHRKKNDWGPLTGFFNWAMDRHDREKDKIVSRFVRLDERSDVLDVGCAVGTFLQKMRARHGARATGVDFKDLSASPTLDGVDFRCGLFYEQDFGDKRFDLVTMWHFLEHDYDPMRTLSTARDLLKPDGRLVIEVPRLDSTTFRLYGDRWPGLQAPQHTVLYDRTTFLARDGQGGARRRGVSAVRRVPGVLLLLRRRRVQDAAWKGAQPLARDLSVFRRADPLLAGARVREAAQLRDADGRVPEARMSSLATRLRLAGTFVFLTLGALGDADRRHPDALRRAPLLLRSHGALAGRDGARYLGRPLPRARRAAAGGRSDDLRVEPLVDARRLRAHRARPAAHAILSQRLSQEDAADRHRRDADPDLLDRAAGISRRSASRSSSAPTAFCARRATRCT